ncbi:MAG: hypothetical protein OEN23_08910 [Paracoccaceae bacterium]|nr:hypothetical protein [Paracoccaceae bacterium]
MARSRSLPAFFAALVVTGLALGPLAIAGNHNEDEPRYARAELHLISEGRFVPDGILFAARGAAGWQGPVYLLSTRKVAEVRDEDRVNLGVVLEFLNTNVTQDITAQRFRKVPPVAEAARAGDYLVLVFPDTETLARVAGQTRTTYLADSYGKTYVVEGRPKPAEAGARLSGLGPPLGEIEAKSRNTELAIIVTSH